MVSLEEALKIDPNYAVSADLNQKLYDEDLRKGWKARDLMKVSTFGVIIFWFVVFIFFIIEMH